MKIFFDTEFNENGETIDLISFGAVREDGEELYLINKDMDVSSSFLNDWVRENVLKGIYNEMLHRETRVMSGWKFYRNDFWFLLQECGNTKKEIAEKIVKFAGDEPEFYAYFAYYDWVVLCQIFGTMMDLPTGWPMYCRDLKQTADELSFDTSTIHNLDEHNPLSDARYCFELWKAMKSLKVSPY